MNNFKLKLDDKLIEIVRFPIPRVVRYSIIYTKNPHSLSSGSGRKSLKLYVSRYYININY